MEADARLFHQSYLSIFFVIAKDIIIMTMDTESMDDRDSLLFSFASLSNPLIALFRRRRHQVAGVATILLALFAAGCLADPSKAMVLDVHEDSPAEKAGIERGMIIERIDYEKDDMIRTENVTPHNSIDNIVSSLSPGDRITLHIDADGERKKIENIVLVDRSGRSGRKVDENTSYLGIETGATPGFFANSVYCGVHIIAAVVMGFLVTSVIMIERRLRKRKKKEEK